MSRHSTRWREPEGPTRAHEIREGSNVELSNGHVIQCMTAGMRHGGAHTAGTLAVATATVAGAETGIDVGVAWNDGKNLRAPDLSVGINIDRSGWAGTAPPLAIEYASSGQDERELEAKISELLEFGTRVIWVVRLTGPLRVEVHEPGQAMRLVNADGELAAPGILLHPVPVRALIDPSVAVETALHNLLAQKGYRSIEAIRDEGHKQGFKAGVEAETINRSQEILRVLVATRGWQLPPALDERITACRDPDVLMRWLSQVIGADNLEAALR